MIKFRIGNAVYKSFTAASVFTSMSTMAAAFELTTSIQEATQSGFPIQKGQDVQVYVDDELVTTGRFEWFDQRYSAAEDSITFGGRTITGDVVDSTVGLVKEIKGGVDLVDVITTTLRGMGLADIGVVDSVRLLRPFTSSEIISADVGMNAYDYLEGYARKRQVLLTSTPEGSIELVRNDGTGSGASLINRRHPNHGRNNVLAYNGGSDDRKRFNVYTARSQLNPSAPNFSALASTVTGPSGIALDTGIRPGRRLEFTTEESMDAGECLDRAIWESNIRRSNATSAKYTVSPHKHRTGLWRPNRIVEVTDEMADLHSGMLIRDVRFDQSVARGSTTELTLVPPDAYTLLASRPATKKKESVLFDNWVKDNEAD